MAYNRPIHGKIRKFFIAAGNFLQGKVSKLTSFEMKTEMNDKNLGLN